VREKEGNVVRNAEGHVRIAAGSLDRAAGVSSRSVSEGYEIAGKKVSAAKASRTFEDEAREIRRKSRELFRA
jgi:hypothetical protein